jgi:hypothetical protein
MHVQPLKANIVARILGMSQAQRTPKTAKTVHPSRPEVARNLSPELVSTRVIGLHSLTYMRKEFPPLETGFGRCLAIFPPLPDLK